MATSSTNVYDNVSKAFHWLTALLVLIAFFYGLGGPEKFVYSPERLFQRQLHETLGVTVLGLSFIRVLWRFFGTRPAESEGPAWMKLSAQIVQALLYALLFIVPLTAISGAWMQGHSIDLLGSVTVPALLPQHHSFGDFFANIHGWLGDLIIWIAGAHAAAGLFHHYILRDKVLQSMLPIKR